MPLRVRESELITSVLLSHVMRLSLMEPTRHHGGLRVTSKLNSRMAISRPRPAEQSCNALGLTFCPGMAATIWAH